jgi:FkbM family methyltransferase
MFFSKKTIGNCLRSVGLEDAARGMWYRFFGSRITRSVSICNHTCSFHCPSPMVSDSVSSVNKERTAIEWFLSQIREGDTVWDVGANIGLWTVFTAKQIGISGKVAAFEPYAAALPILKANLDLNGVSNATVFEVALGKENGRIAFYPALPGVFSTSSLAYRSGRFGTKNEPVHVPLKRGASVVDGDPSLLPDALKLDVEGAEQAVLEGFSDSIWQRLRILAIEVHPDFLPSLGGNTEEVRRLIRDHGLTIVKECSRRNTLHWLCQRQPS